MPDHPPTGQPRLPSGAPLEILIDSEGVEDANVVRPKTSPQKLPPVTPETGGANGVTDPCVNISLGDD